MYGVEWVVEAHGCDPAALTDLRKLKALFDSLTSELALHPVADASWHQFGGAGGITGLRLLSESHIACHTFPEFGSLCLNVFCCRPRQDADLETLLKDHVQAAQVHVRRLERPY